MADLFTVFLHSMVISSLFFYTVWARLI